MEKLENDLAGDVKRLTDFTPEYRLKESEAIECFLKLEQNIIVVYHMRHRRKASRDLRKTEMVR